ncbi:MAG TPA: OmpA family protein [Vicinamibacterales bacterium]|nr:OmpA family protein [Vicinamibacterales bacterium]
MAGTGDRLAPPHLSEADERREADHADEPEIESLQALLLGPTGKRLDRLQARMDDPHLRAADVGAVLPEVLVRHADDPQLARALTPPLERAITSSVKRNPAPLADALFPVMGPAIRKAVSASLAAMIESLNRTLEHAVSWRSFKWRLEAMRTHRSFAEIVLLKTLLYRVEQLFLIDRRTGLLLLHVQPGAAAVQDADMVSGMLTAIRDFVKDSFKVADTESLDALKVGELSVWIEPGPHALLAAVIRGTAPSDFRAALQEAIEAVHLQFGAALETFDGDASVFAGARPILEGCLASEYRAEERRRPPRWAWVLFATLLAAMVVWVGLGVRDRRRLDRYLDAVRAEPGLTVISSERRGGRFVVTGLRDPLARDPQTLLAGASLTPEDVEGRWTPYQALEPPLIVARATEALTPPAGASLAVADGVLSVAGAVTPAWIAEARRLAPLIGGVTRFDAAAALAAATREAAARLESTVLLFAKGSAELAGDQADERARLMASLADLEAIAAAAGDRIAIDVQGHTDTDGVDEANLPLSEARAAVVLRLLRAETMPHLTFTTTGVGSRMPATTGRTEADLQRNRRVTLRLAKQTGGRP